MTGASGFIGRQVCARLTGNVEVFAVARGPQVPAGCIPVRADLGAAFSTEGWPDRLDCVVHLAQSARHREFPDGAADMTAINVAATASLIEYARRAGASAFILASTGNVYAPGPEPVGEDDPIAPGGFYAASKAAAEDLVRPYATLLRVCTLRLFYPYGPGQEGRLIPSLIERVRHGRPISLSGADGLVMTPTYVDDIAAVIAAAIGDPRFTGVLNVSAPWVMTLREVGQSIGLALGQAPLFEQAGGPEPPRVVPRLDRLAALYPPARFTPLDAGLAQMLREKPLVT
jgi:nucleoside-diphosphate-sugar epimerase